MTLNSKLFLATLAFWSAAVFALPSTQDVQGAINAGDYARAESMMKEVVTAKPQSAKAHYVYAEILAHDAKFADAEAQAQQAQQIDPSLGFTDPQKFRSFEQLLLREQHPGATVPPRTIDRTSLAPAAAPRQAGTGVPGWVWGAGLALIAFLVWRVVSRRAAAQVMPAPAPFGSGMSGASYGAPGYGYAPSPSPAGSALRTGLAVAGGVAGGMLLEKYLEGERAEAAPQAGAGWVDDGSARAASELENRPIDFGQGSSWGADLGPADDSTPSGDGGGW
jgi:hypothetical protein